MKPSSVKSLKPLHHSYSSALFAFIGTNQDQMVLDQQGRNGEGKAT